MAQVPYFESEKIAEGSWLIRYAFEKSTMSFYCYLVEGETQALVIDTMMGWGNLKRYCETLTDKPLTLVNTHFHGDHTGGNFHFDACWMHHRDIALFQNSLRATKAGQYARAKEVALPEYRDLIEEDDNFRDAVPMKVYPLYDGDSFDLGDRKIRVVEVGGHTPGSIVLIDPKTRIAYTGDACNGNTLLEFDYSLTIVEYMRALLHFNEFRDEFDVMYGGHQIFDADILDEAIETVARVIAGTDDKFPKPDTRDGRTVLYAAARRAEGHGVRLDGKRFNMSYTPEKVRRSGGISG